MSEIDWSKAPEGMDYAFTTGPNWSGDADWVGKIRFAFDRAGSLSGVSILNNSAGPCLELGDSAWVFVGKRPTQWRGPEDGLPPVGTVCEVWRRNERVECEIVAHVQSDGVTEAVYQCATDWGWSATGFCPLKSDKERAVDAAMKVMPYPGSPSTRADLECAYDAGLLRLPEEQS